MKRIGIKHDHYIDKDAYFYFSDSGFLYWRTNILGDILRAPNGDNMP